MLLEITWEKEMFLHIDTYGISINIGQLEVSLYAGAEDARVHMCLLRKQSKSIKLSEGPLNTSVLLF